MPTTRNEVLTAALLLSESDRLVLIGELLETMPDELPFNDSDQAEFHAELERRSTDWQGAVPWEQLRDELSSP